MSARLFFAYVLVIILSSRAHGQISEEQMADYSHSHHDESNSIVELTETYATSGNQTLLWLHIICMSVAFVGLFPVGVMLGISRSRWHPFFQTLGTIIATLGYIFILGFKTQSLYPNNFHRKFGYILMCIVTVQSVFGLVRYIFKPKDAKSQGFSPIASNDSSSENSTYADMPGSAGSRQSELSQKLFSNRDSIDIESTEMNEPSDIACKMRSIFESILPSKILAILSHVSWYYVHKVIGRVFILLTWTQVILGFVTYTGTCQGEPMGNCLAHYIKGSLFVWFGILAFARYLGCWAEYGWAWNDVASEKNVVSFSLIEASIVFAYGITNTFLEHTGESTAWNHRDLQHASLAFMWWWAGTCAILLESKRIRKIISRGFNVPFTSTTSSPIFSPVVALILIATGISMGAHHQTSEFSIKVHQQFATFLVLGGLARLATIIFQSMSKHDSKARYIPSRPPTELVTAFCIIAAGFTLMVANKDLVKLLDVVLGFDTNFVFNLVVASTFFILSYEIVLLTIKNSSK